MSDTWNTVKDLTPGNFVMIEVPDGTLASGYVRAVDEKTKTVVLLGTDATEKKVSFAPKPKDEVSK